MGALNRSLRVVQAAPASHFDRSAGCLREIHSERLTGHCFLHPRAKRGGSCPTTDPEITEKLLRCQLFGSKTDNSNAGVVRKAWREHLGLDEDELRILARTLAFGEVTDSLQDLRDRLDMTFRAMGLRRVPAHENAFFYDDLIFQWMGQKRLEFDRRSFREACEQERVLVASIPAPKVYGVKSFEHAFDHLEDRCEDVLDFVPVFDERYIRSDADWSMKLYPELRQYLASARPEIRK